MKKEDCLKWAEVLINGKYKKKRGTMSNAKGRGLTKTTFVEGSGEPTACCCLGVLNETFKPNDFELDRCELTGRHLAKDGIINQANPLIFGVAAGLINDGPGHNYAANEPNFGIPRLGMTHEEIGTLLLLAVESGEYKNI